MQRRGNLFLWSCDLLQAWLNGLLLWCCNWKRKFLTYFIWIFVLLRLNDLSLWNGNILIVCQTVIDIIFCFSTSWETLVFIPWESKNLQNPCKDLRKPKWIMYYVSCRYLCFWLIKKQKRVFSLNLFVSYVLDACSTYLMDLLWKITKNSQAFTFKKI